MYAHNFTYVVCVLLWTVIILVMIAQQWPLITINVTLYPNNVTQLVTIIMQLVCVY